MTNFITDQVSRSNAVRDITAQFGVPGVMTCLVKHLKTASVGQNSS